MPYIKQMRRQQLDRKLDNLYIADVGSLNYVIMRLLNNYCEINTIKYGTVNDIMGVLECIKQEFYRRVAVGFETTKINENGDIEWPK
jgi:broad-specificity NMP kinase